MRKKKEETPVTPIVSVPKIRARIIDGSAGLSFLPEVSAVRIRDIDYGLLVMEDFMPTLGGIDGTIVFLTPQGEVRYDKIKGFYKHQQNEFTLIIQDKTIIKALEDDEYESAGSQPLEKPSDVPEKPKKKFGRRKKEDKKEEE